MPPPTTSPRGARLQAPTVPLVAVCFVDNAGVLRAKGVTVDRLTQSTRAGVGASESFAVFRSDDGMAELPGRANPVGDVRLLPDLTTLAVPPGRLGWVAADQVTQTGEAWAHCGRAFVRRMVGEAAQQGLSARMAFEHEWSAWRDEGIPVHHGPAYGLAALIEASPYIGELVDTLASFGLGVEQLHAEASAGQLEVSVAPADPVSAADRSVLLRHAVRTASRAAGLEVSFAPLVDRTRLGNGMHLHWSIWRDERNLFGAGAGPGGLDLDGEAFLAGVLASLDALVALGCASPASYLRLRPSRWVGVWRCWGTENREAPLRFIQGTGTLRPSAANAELKPLDASGNPYLVAGAVLAAGLDGIRRNLRLPPEVLVDPATLSDAERAERGIDRLPADLTEAADALERNEVLATALGDELHRTLVALRRSEAETAAGLGDAHLIAQARRAY